MTQYGHDLFYELGQDDDMTTFTIPPSSNPDATIQNALKTHTTALLVFGILFLVVGSVAFSTMMLRSVGASMSLETEGKPRCRRDSLW